MAGFTSAGRDPMSAIFGTSLFGPTGPAITNASATNPTITMEPPTQKKPPLTLEEKLANLKVKLNELISSHNFVYDEQKALLEEIRKDLTAIQQREEFYNPQISKLSIENMELRQEIDSLKLRLLDMATKTEAVEKSMHIMMGMFLTANPANAANLQ